jgi:hypothetical protein
LAMDGGSKREWHPAPLAPSSSPSTTATAPPLHVPPSPPLRACLLHLCRSAARFSLSLRRSCLYGHRSTPILGPLLLTLLVPSLGNAVGSTAPTGPLAFVVATAGSGASSRRSLPPSMPTSSRGLWIDVVLGSRPLLHDVVSVGSELPPDSPPPITHFLLATRSRHHVLLR